MTTGCWTIAGGALYFVFLMRPKQSWEPRVSALRAATVHDFVHMSLVLFT
jgi:hypothetical protein